jgi:hypothetical protein
MRFKIISLLVLLIIINIPTIVFANIVCNDGSISKSCVDCHSGCCSRHGGCTNNPNHGSNNSYYPTTTKKTTTTIYNYSTRKTATKIEKNSYDYKNNVDDKDEKDNSGLIIVIVVTSFICYLIIKSNNK